MRPGRWQLALKGTQFSSFSLENKLLLPDGNTKKGPWRHSCPTSSLSTWGHQGPMSRSLFYVQRTSVYTGVQNDTAIWAWQNYLISLCLNFFTYKRLCIAQSFSRIKLENACKTLSTVLGTPCKLAQEFLGSPVVKTVCFQCRKHRFDPWSGN